MSSELINIAYPEVADLTTSAELYEEMKKNLLGESKVALDLGKVERITTPAIQLLYCLKRDDELWDKLTITDCSNVVVESCAMLGLNELAETLKESVNG